MAVAGAPLYYLVVTEPTPGTQLTPELRLVRHLARGSMGSLWVARHEGLGAEVVVKFLFEGTSTNRIDLARFEREATVLASIQSPYVVRYLEHGVSAGLPFLVLEHLEGYDLSVALRRHGPLSPGHVALVIDQVALALSAIHGLGVVHRDVKPSNIFLCGGLQHLPVVKLLDFGIAKCLRAGEPLTSTGQLVGTPNFMSPEQLKAKPVDHRSDLWALGVVTYRALTGQLPFAGETFVEVVMQVVSGRMTPPSSLRPELPASVDRWVERACALDPEARFASAEQMAQALWDALGTRGRTAPSPSGGPMLSSSTTLGLSAVSRAAVLAAAEATSTPPGAPSQQGRPSRLRAGAWAFGLAAAAGGAISLGWGATHRAPPGKPPVVLAQAVRGGDAPERPLGAPSAPALTRPPVAPPASPCPAGMAALGGTGAALAAPAAFCLDAHEVTVDEYRDCVRADACAPATAPPAAQPGGARAAPPAGAQAGGAHATRLAGAQPGGAHAGHPAQPGGAHAAGGSGRRAFDALCTSEQPGRDRHPVNCVDWAGADAYCRRAGKRLPRPDEWEFAVRGAAGRTYPWGEEAPTANHLNGCGTECARWGARHHVVLDALYPDDDGFYATAPVGTFPRGRSVEGVFDLLGNVMEWADDGAAGAAPAGGEGPRLVMGSAWDVSSPAALRATPRASMPPSTRSHLVGFRCASSPVAPPAGRDLGGRGRGGAVLASRPWRRFTAAGSCRRRSSATAPRTSSRSAAATFRRSTTAASTTAFASSTCATSRPRGTRPTATRG